MQVWPSRMESAGRESEDESIREQMKGSGIGTPATRAAIIERLVQVGYVRRKGKTLLATEKGIQLIAIMPEEICSPETTGRWKKARMKSPPASRIPSGSWRAFAS